MLPKGLNTARAVFPIGPWYFPTTIASTIPKKAPITALPEAAAKYLKYIGFILQLSKSINPPNAQF